MKGFEAVKDTYKQTKTIQFDNGIARVHQPKLTPEEHRRRMQQIHNAAADLLKGRKPK